MNSYSFSNRVQSKREINTPTRSILATFVLFFTSYEKQTKNYGHFLIFFSYFRKLFQIHFFTVPVPLRGFLKNAEFFSFERRNVLLHSSKSFFKSPRRANIHRHLPASLLYNSFFRSYSSSGSTTTPSFLRPSIFTVSGRSKCTQRRNFVSSTAGMEFSNS